MKKQLEARPRWKVIASALVVPTLLFAGYWGIHFASANHVSASASHLPPIVDSCPPSSAHC